MTTTPTDATNPDVHASDTDRDGRARTWLKPEQVERLRDECLTDTCPPYLQDRDEAIITLAYEAGLRAGELVALDVDHVDLEAGTVFLPSAIQKGSPPPATLSLERDTVRTLRRYLRDRWKESRALFPTRSSDRMTTRSLRRLVEKLAQAAPLESGFLALLVDIGLLDVLSPVNVVDGGLGEFGHLKRFVDFLAINAHDRLAGDAFVIEYAEHFVIVFQRVIPAGRPLDRAVLSVDRLVVVEPVEQDLSRTSVRRSPVFR